MLEDPLLDGIQQPMQVDVIHLDFSLPGPLEDIQPLEDQPSEAEPSQTSFVAEPVNITQQPPSLNLPPPQTPSTAYATPPPRSTQRRSRYLQPQRCQQSDYNDLFKAETAKANVDIRKLELECKVLEKKDKIADLKIALLTRKLNENHM